MVPSARRRWPGRLGDPGCLNPHRRSARGDINAVGLDYTLPEDARLNVQAFQRVYFGHDPDMLQDRYETGATFLYNRKLRQKVEGEILWIQSLNRWENLIRPRIIWRVEQNLRVSFGVDIFNGPVTGVLGRYANRDRIYIETRYDF